MHIIVGVDPGKTCGIACLDMNGRLVFSTHKTFASTDWIVSEVSKIGIPSIIAGDKPAGSEAIRKINAAFNARLFTPSKELTIDEKRGLGKTYGIKDPHERDAFAAALKAYNSYSNKFNQVERIAANGSIDDIDALKAKIVSKYSINEAIGNKKANRK
ncbi:MAG: DUF460 domain-containing protein [Candidatus Micrarchaeota archaeon]|nr:DUF460 domain-containing protein [Candidatus Micrarchaeota archaeon]